MKTGQMKCLPLEGKSPEQLNYRHYLSNGETASAMVIKKPQGFFCPVRKQWQPKYRFWVSQFGTNNGKPDGYSYSIPPAEGECLSLVEARKQVTILWHEHIGLSFCCEGKAAKS